MIGLTRQGRADLATRARARHRRVAHRAGQGATSAADRRARRDRGRADGWSGGERTGRDRSARGRQRGRDRRCWPDRRPALPGRPAGMARRGARRTRPGVVPELVGPVRAQRRGRGRSLPGVRRAQPLVQPERTPRPPRRTAGLVWRRHEAVAPVPQGGAQAGQGRRGDRHVRRSALCYESDDAAATSIPPTSSTRGRATSRPSITSPASATAARRKCALAARPST